MDNKRIVNTIGIIVGVVIIIIGFCVQGTKINTDSYLLGSQTIGKSIEFGGDFYTEIYDVTKDVGQAVNSAKLSIGAAINNAQANIGNAIKSACKAIGWLIVTIGAFDICYFAKNMFDSDNISVPNDHSDISGHNAPEAKQTVSNPVSVVAKAPSIVDGKWICGSCQTENSVNYGQCKKCGKFRG